MMSDPRRKWNGDFNSAQTCYRSFFRTLYSVVVILNVIKNFIFPTRQWKLDTVLNFSAVKLDDFYEEIIRFYVYHLYRHHLEGGMYRIAFYVMLYIPYCIEDKYVLHLM